jgi:crossover junction endodeoxyribonuclease RuvC
MKPAAMVYIGIDPGLDGAVAAITSKREVFVWDTPTLTTKSGGKNRRRYIPAQMVHILRSAAELGVQQIVALELVHAMPKQGVASMFNMGRGLGLWEGIVAALGLPLIQVSPQVWKKAMLGGAGADKTASRIVAARLFPHDCHLFSRVKDDGRAEAALMAQYVRERGRK